MIEFFIDKVNGTDLIINDNGKFSTLEECHPLVDTIYKSVKDNYTEAFEALHQLYGGSAFFKFLIVRRFLKCNFARHDEKPDIDEKGFFEIEFVNCPMRGECKHENIICNARVNRVLSTRETEIVKLICKGLTDHEIAEQLFISVNTAKNHRRNILHKTGCSNTAALVAYATERKL